ncbi:MAG: hypothetical protein GX100_04140 [candidate division WS1 bacterium]|nr:hypothetical protein [candidate division WS1 bacterium]
MRNQVWEELSRFRAPEQGVFGYRARQGLGASLAASCDAALILYSTGGLEGYDLAAWAGYLNSFQDAATGWFQDDGSAWVTPLRVQPWLFGLVLRALNALHAQPAFRASFLKVWDTPEKMRDWICAGRDFMHLAIIWFGSARGRYPFDDFEATFFQALSECREHFIPDRVAFQQVRAQHPPAAAQMILKDAFHNLFAWYAAGREVPELPLYIDWVLHEQDENGLFFQEGTRAPVYSHMDGMQMVVEFSQRTDYRGGDCCQAVERGLEAVLAASNSEFFWRTGRVHSLLASCETVAQAARLLRGHPLAEGPWRCVWDLRMWHLGETHFLG